MARYSSYYKPRSLRKREQKSRKILMRNIVLGILLLSFIFFWGLPTLAGSLSVFNRFKKADTTKPISVDETLAPPVLNIPYEATNTATIKISGFAQPKSKVEIFVDDDKKDTNPTGDDGSFKSGDVPLNLGTNNIYGKVVDEKNHESLPSKTIRVSYSSDKPKLDVSSPADNTQVKGGDKKVTITGATDPDNNLVVNGVVIVLSSDGHFSTTVSLNDGDNNITISATNSFGNSTQVVRKVIYSAS